MAKTGTFGNIKKRGGPQVGGRLKAPAGMKRCPPGHVFNHNTGRCEKKK